ncbi:hypothetical protein [Streptomyces globisporus]|uniref:hypothetical protein n=1 Tax=Streptomyces globisporus TaxID=1908 RepID=UPI0036B73BC2
MIPELASLSENELNALCEASALVVVGLKEARQDKDCDGEMAVFQARDLISSYMESRMGFDRETADSLSSSLVLYIISEGRMQ